MKRKARKTERKNRTVDKSENFTRELPAGYRLVKTVDAGEKRFAILMNLCATVLTAAVGTVGFFLKFGKNPALSVDIGGNVWEFEGILLALVASLVAYIVLHELTHGAVYRILTGEKLTFGLKLSCAFCGVPNIYVTKKTALLALLAPFTVFSAVFLVPFILLPGTFALAFLILFAIHFGGCVGDLYDSFLLIFRIRGRVLVRDTGPKQTFYVFDPTDA